jgi:ABC-type dipeptide/oligopeptide/nickel transport system ATPase component
MPPLPLLQPVASNGSHNLPAQITKRVGRADTVRILAAQLSQERFVTIVGPGGVGKTSVALAVAEAVAADFEHGVWLVDLAQISDPRLVPGAICIRAGQEALRRSDPSWLSSFAATMLSC